MRQQGKDCCPLHSDLNPLNVFHWVPCVTPIQASPRPELHIRFQQKTYERCNRFEPAQRFLTNTLKCQCTGCSHWQWFTRSLCCSWQLPWPSNMLNPEAQWLPVAVRCWGQKFNTLLAGTTGYQNIKHETKIKVTSSQRTETLRTRLHEHFRPHSDAQSPESQSQALAL
jgi:hypothetical protein